MTSAYEDAFENEMKEMFSSQSRAIAFLHFQRAMRAKAEQVSRELSLNDTPCLQAQAGKITILHELADWAISALKAAKSEANDNAAEEIPRGGVQGV